MEQMFTATGGPTDVLSGVICSGCRALTWNRCLQLLEGPHMCCLRYCSGCKAVTWNRCLQLLEDPQTCCLRYSVGAVGQ